jgi:hypothetical protein
MARVEVDKAISHVPMETRNYTDYVSSRGHFENVSGINYIYYVPSALVPNYL